MEKTKQFKINFTLSISDKEYGYNSIVSTSVTNDVPKGEDPERFLRRRLNEEIKRMLRGVDDDALDFETKEDELELTF